jgi:hypothetical protein
MNRIAIVATCLFGMALCACDKLQQQGPPPSYESSALDAARSISGSQTEGAASAASGADVK